MRKINLITIATAAMTLAVAGAANAVAIFGTQGSGSANVAWTGTSLTVTDTAGGFIGKNGYVASNDTFTGEATSIVFSGGSLTTSGSSFTETLGSGTFTTTGPGGTISGVIAAGDSFSGSTSGPAAFSFLGVPGNVTYTNTPLFDTTGLSLSGGSFSVEAIDVAPGTFGITSGKLNAFTAVDETTFSAVPTSTPEPASVVTFGLGAMALVLMAGIARRRNANSTL